MSRIEGIDNEKKRALVLFDIETGQPYQTALKSAQHEVLPTMNTELIKVSYQL